MRASVMIESLATSGEAIVVLADTLTAQAASWSPDPDRWSSLEVLCHLRDEETEDFGQRLRLVLEDPSLDWPPIDPQDWVTSRNYAAQDLRAVVAEFRTRRASSLEWLRSLGEVDWEQAKEHPTLRFVIPAGDLLAAWAAHDLIHLRQLTRLQLKRIEQEADPFSTAYAT